MAILPLSPSTCTNSGLIQRCMHNSANTPERMFQTKSALLVTPYVGCTSPLLSLAARNSSRMVHGSTILLEKPLANLTVPGSLDYLEKISKFLVRDVLRISLWPVLLPSIQASYPKNRLSIGELKTLLELGKNRWNKRRIYLRIERVLLSLCTFAEDV